MMKKDGIPDGEFLSNYRRYEAESRDVAILCLKECEELRKSYVALEIEDSPEFLRESWSNSDTNAVTVFRDEAPNAGSKIMVDLPKANGLA